MLAGKTILLGVSGGIAAYKACELARLLQREGANVRVVLTPHAAQFVTPLTFTALTGHSAAVDEFPSLGQAPEGDVYAHLNLPRGVDCFVIAPASATTLSRLATGLADNLLAAAYLSCVAPVVLAPAMNVRMWQHPATQANIATLRSRGHVIVEPGVGELACGDQGAGRLAELPEIFAAVVHAATGKGSAPGAAADDAAKIKLAPGDLAGRRVIVTAGGTREYLDPVRFITNASSGTFGQSVAAELVRRGAKVELIDTGIELPSGIEGQLAARQIVRTAFDLQAMLAKRLPKAEALVMLAAVADYGPAKYIQNKRKKDGHAWSLELVETPDVLAGIGQQRPAGAAGPLLIGVSLEDTDWIERARAKAASKGVDLMIAVELGADLPFGERRMNCALVTPGEVLAAPEQRSKTEAARLVADWLAQRFAQGTS